MQHLQHLSFLQKFLLQNLRRSAGVEICWKLEREQLSLSLSFIISCFVFNSSLVEEDNDSFGYDALELDGKQEHIMSTF